MTLIAAYSYEPYRTVFVSDFRTTAKPPLHSDNAFKFVPIGSSAGMFLAGDVNGWNIIFERESQRLNAIKNENFMEEFSSILREYATSSTPILNNGKGLKALGFVIDTSNNSNKTFHIDYIQGRGAMISELEQNQVYLFGSGADIGGLKEYLNNALFKYTSDLKMPSHLKAPYLVANTFERFISTYVENLNDPSIYQKKGISNVFSYSYIDQGFFEICSYNDKKYQEEGKEPQEFSYEKNENGEIVLVDKTKKAVSNLFSLDKINLDKPINIDPFDREES
ncbi:hypothetical protein [Priestia megaterium]|uniref:Uncharacterized protein n=1 Tax=Priestia megaterium TaxID=1404 RepID=A0A6M6EAH0_PRIMG|nr:hypothetical protein [Priestia megaterium]QJX81368.1 hypothetical protein FDZ14_35285 [Priestia megaterium]